MIPLSKIFNDDVILFCLLYTSIYNSGPNGLAPANELTQHLMDLGIEMRRFKTGTPARINRKSVDFSKMIEQPGDEKIVPFSFMNDNICLLYTSR